MTADANDVNPKSDKDKPATEEAPPAMVGTIPAAAVLYGPHPHEGEEGATGSSEADLERAEAEMRDKKGK
jgi:hypothetical protein